jgi:arabinan endo-1,5-alpha-L-arabinosidase
VLALTFVHWDVRGAEPALLTPAHDPFIMRHGEFFYLVSTGKGIPIRRSKDLIAWQPLGTTGRVFTDLPPWTKGIVSRRKADGLQDDLWGPALFFFNDRFHLYYSVAVFGTNDSGIGLATNESLDPESPNYKWVDQGVVMQSVPGRDDFNAIENEVVVDGQGKPWLLFGSFFSGIKIRRLDLRTGKVSADQPQIHTLATRPENGAIENPSLYFRNGFWYLLASYDLCCKGMDSTYNVRVGRSRALLGPYVDRQGTPLLEGGGTLILAGYDNVRGPGCNSIVVADGREYLVNHYYDADRGGRPFLQVRPLVWEEDGWPLVGESVQPTQESHETVAGRWEIAVNFADGFKFQTTLEPNGNANKHGAKWVSNGDRLRLDWPDPKAPNGVWVNKCVVVPGKNGFVGRNQGGAIIRGQRLE